MLWMARFPTARISVVLQTDYVDIKLKTMQFLGKHKNYILVKPPLDIHLHWIVQISMLSFMSDIIIRGGLLKFPQFPFK